MRRLLLIGVAALAVGCFKPSHPLCAHRCGPGGDCPDDYACGTDGYCHLVDAPPDAGVCTYPDAAGFDAATD